jgi:hypothetical protein
VDVEEFDKIYSRRRAEIGKRLAGKKEKGLLMLDLRE